MSHAWTGSAVQRRARLRTAARSVADDVDKRAGRLRSGEAGGQQAAHSRRRRWGGLCLRARGARTRVNAAQGASQDDDKAMAEAAADPLNATRQPR